MNAIERDGLLLGEVYMLWNESLKLKLKEWYEMKASNWSNAMKA